MWHKSNFLLFFYVHTLNLQGTPEILIKSLCQGEKQHAHTSCLHPKREALSEQRQNTGLWSQEGSTESVLPQRPSHVLPDLPPLEPGRNGACVNVYGPDKENKSSMGIAMVDWKFGCQGFFWLTPHFSSPPPQCSPLPWTVPSIAQGCAAAAWPAETWTTVKSRKKFQSILINDCSHLDIVNYLKYPDLFIAGFLHIKLLSAGADLKKWEFFSPIWNQLWLNGYKKIKCTLPTGKHVVTEKCAGQQRKLWLLHFPLESVKEALQQQGVHVLCGGGG